MLRRIGSLILILVNVACIDRISFDTSLSEYPVVVEGYISDQPGPYEIRISRSFDVQSKNTIFTPISVKSLTIFDDQGNSEILTSKQVGVYNTSVNGIQGVVGRSYHIAVELLDGKAYESTPELMLSTGTVDSVYFSFFKEDFPEAATQYGFDVFFDATTGGNSNVDFLWRFTGTYQVDTNPELYTISCGEARCPAPRPCSGVIVQDGLTRVGPCDCCNCWVDFRNDVPIVSDNQLVQGNRFQNVKGYRVPLNKWIFLHKVYANIEQLSLTPTARKFWKAIKDQKEAVGSLFQPISGQVQSNFIQTSGDSSPLEGFFFATSIKSKGVFITRDDVPREVTIPPQDLPYNDSCLTFPNSTNQKPSYWE